MRPPIFALSLLCLILFSCASIENYRLLRSYEITLADSSPSDTTITNITANRDSQGRQARLLSAFYGLDNDLPRLSKYAVCEGAAGKDGMPVIFSHEIDVTTMQAGDFRVTNASGESRRNYVCHTCSS